MDQLPSDTAEADVLDAALEWLCLNLPNDALPKEFQARGQLEVMHPQRAAEQEKAPAPAAQIETTTDPREATPEALELMRYGFGKSESLDALQKCTNSVLWAFEQLCGVDKEASGDAAEEIDDELLALEAILDNALQRTELEDGSVLQLDIRVDCESGQRADLRVIVRRKSSYPETQPAIAVAVPSLNDAQVAKINRSLREHALELLGAPLVFNLVAHVQSCVDEIAESDETQTQRASNGEATQAAKESKGGKKKSSVKESKQKQTTNAAEATPTDAELKRVLADVEAGVAADLKHRNARRRHHRLSKAKLAELSKELKANFEELQVFSFDLISSL